MRTQAYLFLLLAGCPQLEIFCDESDRCEPSDLSQLPPDQAMPGPMHFTSMSLPAGTPRLRAIGGVSATVNTIFVVGDDGTVLIGDGSAPFVKTAASPTANNTLRGLWVTGPQEVWIADSDSGSVYHTTTAGTSWTNTGAGAALGLQAIFGKSTTDILAVGQDTMEGRHYNGSWAAARYPGPLRHTMYAAWASATNFYMVGSSGAVGKSLTPRTLILDISIPTFNTLRGVWGTDDNNVYAVGSNGAVHKYDGLQWSAMPQGSENLNAIWGNSAQDIWAVGDDGAAYHYDGTRWSNVTSASIANHNLSGVWGDGRGGVWVSATNPDGDGAVFKY